MAVDAFATSAYASVISWTYLLLTLLIVYKIISFFTGAGGRLWGNRGRNYGDIDNYDGNGGRDGDGNTGPQRRTGNRPNRVLVFQGVHRGDSIHLSWADNPEDEHINYYWLERRRQPRFFRRVNRRVIRGWRRVAYVSTNFTPEDPFVDNESFRNHPGIVREFWNSLDAIVPENDYEYRIRAVNSYGKSRWVSIRVSRPLHAEEWVPVIDDLRDDPEGDTTMEGHVERRRL